MKELWIANTTPHPITFDGTTLPQGVERVGAAIWQDGGIEIVRIEEEGGLYVLPPLKVTIDASSTERLISEEEGIAYVTPSFIRNYEGEAIIEHLKAYNPRMIIVGSLIAAQAYPGQVVGMIAAKGYERVPVAEKRMRLNRWTRFV